VIFRFIQAEEANHRVVTLCRVLGVSRSGYYARSSRPPSARAMFDQDLIRRIIEIHVRAPDLVNRAFGAKLPDQLWVSDIKYVHTWEGFLYLAATVDACTRAVVGWGMRSHLSTQLVGLLQSATPALLDRVSESGGVRPDEASGDRRCGVRSRSPRSLGPTRRSKRLYGSLRARLLGHLPQHTVLTIIDGDRDERKATVQGRRCTLVPCPRKRVNSRPGHSMCTGSPEMLIKKSPRSVSPASSLAGRLLFRSGAGYVAT
jgi:hypothetical protein